MTEPIRDIVLTRRDDGHIEVTAAPSLGAITHELLADMDPRFRDPDDDDVLQLADDVRYLIGGPTPDGRGRLLHRIP